MDEKETINGMIDARLARYSSSYELPPRAEILGIILAAWAEWNGVDLLQTLSYALEDSNFHSESAIVDEMVNIINDGDTAQNYQLVKKPAVKVAELPSDLFTRLREAEVLMAQFEIELRVRRRTIKGLEADIAAALQERHNLKGGDGLHGTPDFQRWVEGNRDDLPGDWKGVFLFVDAADSTTTVRLRWDMGRRLPIDGVPLDIVLEMRKAYLEHRQQENAKLSDERHVPATDPARTIQVQSRQPDEIPYTPPYGYAPSGDE